MVATLDSGTTSVKAGIVDFTGRFLGYARKKCPVLNGGSGRAEADPVLLRSLAFETLRDAMRDSGCAPTDVAGISVTGQRASFLPLDGAGIPVGHAILWQDSRGAEEAGLLENRLGGARFRALTGLPLNPVFTVGKLMCFLRHDRERSEKTRRIALISDFLLKECGAGDPQTDHANASLTGLFEIGPRTWSEPILGAAEIPGELLPRPVPSGTVVGHLDRQVATELELPAGIPLVAGAGDHQCAGLGVGALDPGIVELALGTSGVPLMALSRLPETLVPGLMYCCHSIPGYWEVEGFLNSAGAALAWGRRILAPPEGSRNKREKDLPGSGGILFLPYLCGGSSAPHWNPNATGTFLGLTLSASPEDLSRAILEGVLVESGNVLELISGTGQPIREIRVTGGCSQHPLIPRLLAGITGLPVRLPEHREAGLMGAAILAAFGIGAFPTLEKAAAAMVRMQPPVTATEAECEAGAALRERYRSVAASLESAGIFSRQDIR